MIDMEDMYPEGVCLVRGSSKIGMEINANIVDIFNGWISKKQAVGKEHIEEREL